MNIKEIFISERYFLKALPIFLLLGITLTASLQLATVPKVHGANLYWNKSVASLTFFPKALFSQTTWSYLLCSGVLFLIPTAAHRIRIRRGKSEWKAVLEERARIAREFHDSLAQTLAGVVLHLETAIIQSSEEQSKHHMDRALNLARRSIDEAKRTVGKLRQQMDSQMDFASAIKQGVTRQTSESHLNVAFEVKGETRILPEAVKENLLRICEEAIHNTIRHAKARSIYVSVIFNKKELALCVKDDGVGFDADSIPKNGHFGLIGMKERINLIEGTIRICSYPGQGVEILALIPFEKISVTNPTVEWSSTFRDASANLGVNKVV